MPQVLALRTRVEDFHSHPAAGIQDPHAESSVRWVRAALQDCDWEFQQHPSTRAARTGAMLRLLQLAYASLSDHAQLMLHDDITRVRDPFCCRRRQRL